MKFQSLQETLRKNLQERISAGQLTGLGLAEQTGFRQAHISNFLNRKRSLSMDALDRVLSAQRLSILDLLDPEEINKRASVPQPSDDEFQNVALVDLECAATQPLLKSMHAREIHKFRRAFLRRLRADTYGKRRDWERFMAIKADSDAMGMHPRIAPGAVVLIDRHYNSLEAYRKNEVNIYAIQIGRTCKLRYVELAGRTLILRPHNQAYPIEVLPMEAAKQPQDYIVGRVCHVGMEL